MAIFYTETFKKSAKRLAKRYRSFKKDLKAFTDTLVQNPKQGVEIFSGVYKVRLKNSDNNIRKKRRI